MDKTEGDNVIPITSPRHAKDLVALISEMENPHRTKSAGGGRMSFKYATLDDILNQIRDRCAKHNFAFIQTFDEVENGRTVLLSRLIHASGEVASDSYFYFEMNANPQEAGKQITYYRRYTAAALFGITAEEDTDGPGRYKTEEQQEEEETSTNEDYEKFKSLIEVSETVNDLNSLATDIAKMPDGKPKKDLRILWREKKHAIDDKENPID